MQSILISCSGRPLMVRHLGLENQFETNAFESCQKVGGVFTHKRTASSLDGSR